MRPKLALLPTLGVVVIAIIAAYSGYLAWRITDQRSRVPLAVAKIVAEADPDERALTSRRVNMLLRVEDPTFWSNNGIDLSSPGAGQTTLSQGLGKDLFFRHFSPGPLKLGKLELMLLTRYALTPSTSKRDILTAVVSNAYVGSDTNGPVIGFAEGARRYYGQPLAALSDRQFLSLVATLPAPSRFNPARHPAANAERVSRIERLLTGACQPTGLNDVYLEGCAVAS